jgi:hypothetical protein
MLGAVQSIEEVKGVAQDCSILGVYKSREGDGAINSALFGAMGKLTGFGTCEARK